MEYIADTFEHAGYRVHLIADEDAQSPDDYGDNGVFLVTTENRYFERLHNNMDAQECADDKDLKRTHWRFPLFAYIHSGVALSLRRGGQFNDPWDSGQIGFVFVEKSEFRYQFKERKKCVSAFTAAKNLVETWNQYLSGDVWGYVVSEVDDDGEEVRHIDSCWGFYGLDYARSEAKEVAESSRQREDREAAKIDAMLHV